MAKTYVDGLLDDSEYTRQKKLLEMELKAHLCFWWRTGETLSPPETKILYFV
jgi:hypothetical protein